MKNQPLKRIVVVGGTGLVGSRIVAKLREKAFDAVAASPNTGVNTLTGEGLAEVLDGSSTLVDVTNSPSFEEDAVIEFFTTSTRNLLKYEEAAGVQHHVLLSIVGMDRVSGSGYFRAKIAQEQLVKESPIPFSIVRATQFFEFIKGIADAATDGDTVRLPHVQFRPIAADDVASSVAEIATGSPLNRTLEIGGPELFYMDDLIRKDLGLRNDPRTVVADPNARYFGAELSDSTLVPQGDAQLSETRFDSWLDRASGSINRAATG